MMYTAQEICFKLKASIAPIYIVVGTELALHDYVKSCFYQTFVSCQEDIMQWEVYQDIESRMDDFLLNISSTSLFSTEKQAIWIDHATFLGSEKTIISQAQIEALMDYINHPNPDITLIFSVPLEKLDQRKKINKTLLKQSVMIDASPLSEQQFSDFFVSYLTNTSYRFQKEAWDRFLVLTELNLTRAQQELDKLLLFAGEKTTITKNMVEQSVVTSLTQNIFDLIHLLLKNQKDQAYHLYQQLLNIGEAPQKILSLFITQYRLYLKIALLLPHYSYQEIAQQLMIHPYRTKCMSKDLKNTSSKQLIYHIKQLINLDEQIKQGMITAEYALSLFILSYIELPLG